MSDNNKHCLHCGVKELIAKRAPANGQTFSDQEVFDMMSECMQAAWEIGRHRFDRLNVTLLMSQKLQALANSDPGWCRRRERENDLAKRDVAGHA